MPFSVTTPIYYVNSDPHLGHAYTTVAADALARHHRQRGEDVFFLTGTDEHGAKVAQAAAEAPASRRRSSATACRPGSATWSHRLEASNDFFIRTTDREHERRVQDFMVRLRDAGHLYEDTYSGLYCTGCEQFYAESELEQPGNICPLHKRPVERLEEENTFFRLSGVPDAAARALRPRPRVRHAARPLQRGPLVHRVGPVRLLGQPGDGQLGRAAAVEARADRLRVGGRAPQLPHGPRVRPGRGRLGDSSGRRCTCSARTSCACTACSGRRC